MTAIFSSVASRFSTEKQRYIGLVESALGFGEMVGPPMSSFIFGSAGMGWVFFTFAILNVLNLICLLMFLPQTGEANAEENNFRSIVMVDEDDLNRSELFESSESGNRFNTSVSKHRLTVRNQEKYNMITAEQMTICTCFVIQPCMLSLLANCIADYNICFYEGFFPLRMEQIYFVDESLMGFVLMCNTLPYLFSCILVPLIFKKVPTKVKFIICYLMSAVGYMFIGPSQLFHIPDQHLIVVLVGLLIHGAGQAFILVPTIPETIEAIQLEFNVIDGVDPMLD